MHLEAKMVLPTVASFFRIDTWSGNQYVDEGILYNQSYDRWLIRRNWAKSDFNKQQITTRIWDVS